MATQDEKDAAAAAVKEAEDKAAADLAAAESANPTNQQQPPATRSATQPSGTVEVPAGLLQQIQEQMLKMEMDLETERGARVALENLIDSDKADTEGAPKLREKKSFEPKFRTVRLRKFPIGGDYDNQGIVVGWTSRGSYQQVDRTGVNPQFVDFIEVIFLGHEKTEDGKIKAEKIRTLDLMNAPQLTCKILKEDRVDNIKVPTGEEIDVSIFDPAHGLMSTGEKVDGYTAHSEIKYTLQIPGKEGEHVVDQLYCN